MTYLKYMQFHQSGLHISNYLLCLQLAVRIGLCYCLQFVNLLLSLIKDFLNSSAYLWSRMISVILTAIGRTSSSPIVNGFLILSGAVTIPLSIIFLPNLKKFEYV